MRLLGRCRDRELDDANERVRCAQRFLRSKAMPVPAELALVVGPLDSDVAAIERRRRHPEHQIVHIVPFEGRWFYVGRVG